VVSDLKVQAGLEPPATAECVAGSEELDAHG
jgi:hypothetical protein